MESAFNASLIVLTILYTLLIMAYARIFTRGPGGLALAARQLLVAAVAVHFIATAIGSVRAGACPLGSWAESLSLVAFSISLLYLFIEIRIGDRTTGVFAMAPACVFQVIATISLLGGGPPEPVRMRVLESLHRFAAVISFSGVALCGVYALLYLSMYGAIKRGRFGLFFRKMPPLETLADLNSVAAFGVFLALTVTVVMGVWSRFDPGSKQVTLSQAEVIVTLVMWALYGCCVVAKRFFHLGSKRLAYTTVVGLIVVIGLLVSGFFGQGFHG